MPDNESPVPGMVDAGPSVTVGSTETPAPPVSTPAPPSIDWQKRYSATQETLNKLYERTGFKKLDEIPDAMTWQGWKSAADQLQGVQAQHTELQADHELAQAELSGLRAQNGKLQLLADRYPELMRFNRFIPTQDTPEDQLRVIEEFKVTLGTQGSTAPAPPTGTIPAGGAATEDIVRQAWLDYNQATMAGKDRQEVQTLFEKYARLQADYQRTRGLPDKYAAPRARSIE